MIYFNDKVFYHNFSNFTEKDLKCDEFNKNFYELLYFESGEADISFNSTTFKITKQIIILLKPGTKKIIQLNSEKSSSVIHIFFDKSLCPKDIGNLDNFCNKCYSCKYDTTFNLNVLSLKSVENKSNDKSYFLSYLCHLLPVMIFEISYLNKKFTLTGSDSNKIINSCKNYIKNNITGQISLDDMANQLFVSKSHLAHVFNKQLGMGMRKYINFEKMVYAQKLIHSGVSPVKVCHMLAYDNYSTFFRSYKSIFHLSPEQDKLN